MGGTAAEFSASARVDPPLLAAKRGAAPELAFAYLADSTSACSCSRSALSSVHSSASSLRRHCRGFSMRWTSTGTERHALLSSPLCSERRPSTSSVSVPLAAVQEFSPRKPHSFLPVACLLFLASSLDQLSFEEFKTHYGRLKQEQTRAIERVSSPSVSLRRGISSPLRLVSLPSRRDSRSIQLIPAPNHPPSPAGCRAFRCVGRQAPPDARPAVETCGGPSGAPVSL